jgi:hypothetical protein
MCLQDRGRKRVGYLIIRRDLHREERQEDVEELLGE